MQDDRAIIHCHHHRCYSALLIPDGVYWCHLTDLFVGKEKYIVQSKWWSSIM